MSSIFIKTLFFFKDPQTQFQFRRPALNPVNGQIRNFVLNRIGGVRGKIFRRVGRKT